MERERQGDGVMKAAAKGWVCVWMVYLLGAAIAAARRPHYPPDWKSDLAVLCIYLGATGLVTLIASTCIAVPYIRWVGSERLARKPWRMYLETAALALISTAVLTPMVKPQAESFALNFLPLAAFGLGVSVAGSFFYLRDLKSRLSV
jgi:hypothetical protein